MAAKKTPTMDQPKDTELGG